MPDVTTEHRGAISIIRINRPERLNAINQAVAVEMQQAFKTFDADPNQRVAILSAAGTRAFSAGADVNDLPEMWRAVPTVGFDTDKPIIAATAAAIAFAGAIARLPSVRPEATERCFRSRPSITTATEQAFSSRGRD